LDVQNRLGFNKISNQEYGLILSFLNNFVSSKSQDIRLSLLHNINRFFGCEGSSFWMVNDDYSLCDPVGVNIDQDLLDDYASTYHACDVLHPTKIGTDLFKNTTVIECERFAKYEPDNLYLSRLNESSIYHSHSLNLKIDDKVVASVALFRSFDDKSDSQEVLSAKCLEIVAPFISQEFKTRTALDETTRMASVLQTVLNKENTGVIVFNKGQGNRVVYYNPICVQYCRDFFRGDKPEDTAIQHFVNSVIVPYDVPFAEITDLTVKLKSTQGTNYRVRIVENVEDSYHLCTAYINSLHDDHAIIDDQNFHNQYSVLTPKEREVALLISKGLTNQQIADLMYISLSTVKSHIRSVFEKFRVENRTSLMALLNNSRSSVYG
jgi:DNA-binding CsgD family transcriptional regulator